MQGPPVVKTTLTLKIHWVMNVMKVKHPLVIIYTIYPLNPVNAAETFVNEGATLYVMQYSIGQFKIN